MPGKPDIVLKKYHTVIFIHGCFWHKHKNCKYAFVPASNTKYWLPKLDKNVEKDAIAIKELKRLKWKVLVVWECDLKSKKQTKTLQKILRYIKDKN
jgi:DNA mismatch endonuclease (patch repair protein)